MEGARSIGSVHKIGSLEPGKKADIISIRNKGLNIPSFHNLVIAIRILEMSTRSLWKEKPSKEVANL
uniref:amidohydrolase family protein n=1 Tax=Siminovitchia sp. FSL H7-0308 TaxID=2921432 RepID=UPI00111576D5